MQRARRVLAQPVAQLVRHGPGRLIGDPQLPLQKLGRDAALVATHQIGGEKPLAQTGARAMQHGSGGDRFLPVAGGAFVDPGPRLQPPSLPPAAPGTGKPAGPAKPRQVLNAPLLHPKSRDKFQQPSHPIPHDRPALCYSKARPDTRTFSKPVLPGQGETLKTRAGVWTLLQKMLVNVPMAIIWEHYKERQRGRISFARARQRMVNNLRVELAMFNNPPFNDTPHIKKLPRACLCFCCTTAE